MYFSQVWSMPQVSFSSTIFICFIITGVQVYTDEEFQAAFRKVDKDNSGYITSNEVEQLLFETYGYPPLEEEVKMFMDDFDTNHDGRVSYDEFTKGLHRMRASLQGKNNVACEYQSYNKLNGDRFKHVRMNKNLEEKYKVPMTFNQLIGFKVEDPRNKDLIKMTRHPIKQCAETKYADTMIKTGFPL